MKYLGMEEHEANLVMDTETLLSNIRNADEFADIPEDVQIAIDTALSGLRSIIEDDTIAVVADDNTDTDEPEDWDEDEDEEEEDSPCSEEELAEQMEDTAECLSMLLKKLTTLVEDMKR